MKKYLNIKKRGLLVSLATILLLVAAAAFYINDYYRALPEAFEAVTEVTEGITVLEEEDDYIVFLPENAEKGLIFYPGGKVEYEAYAPLMKALAEQGLLCVLLHMPANLAVLDMGAAQGVQERYPQVDSWYIGGHSLGGSMAASYAGKNSADFDGVILLASYSTADLTDHALRVISLYGSEDGVLNAEKYVKYRDNLPEDTYENVLEGGCHAYFGAYGTQDGDGTPTVTAWEQIQWTVEEIRRMLWTF